MEKPIGTFPKQPGVYMFKDKDGKILYIGKAKDLNNRVKSYFSQKLTDRPWTKIMVGLARTVETIVLNSEYEALLLEAQLIKQNRPAYNIKLLDDKAYPYIKITTSEDFPRALIVRKVINDKSHYFGPFLSTRYISKTLQFIRQVYGIHLNKNIIKPNLKKPCFYCQLDNNPCPLAGEISIDEYRNNVIKARQFLLGNRNSVVRDLKNKVKQAAEKEEYEKAAILRDQLFAIEKSKQDKNLVNVKGNFDAIAISQSRGLTVIVVIRYRDSLISHQKEFYLDDVSMLTEGEVIREFLITFYPLLNDIPPEIIVPCEIEDKDLVKKLIAGLTGVTIKIKTSKGKDERIIELAHKNAVAKLEIKLMKEGSSDLALYRLQQILGLEKYPSRIEAVDISNYSNEAVGTTVCYINGKPDKSEYRKYKIKTVEGQNDFAMIEEVTKRRFSDTTRPVPDIFLIDGGPQQLEFASRALLKTPNKPLLIIALAKKPDRIYVQNKSIPLKIEKNDKGLRFLSMVRDEVHRFSIRYSRQKQIKKSFN